MNLSPHRRTRRSNRGFTLIEALVTLFVTVTILVAMLALFDFSNKLTKVQTQVADMQQELRIGQYELTHLTKMAGRGGLPAELTDRPLPAGVAIEVANNIPASTRIGDSASPVVVQGTDVLTIRGTFVTPIYQINYADNSQWQMLKVDGTPTIDPAQARTVVAQICAISPAGVPQDLTPLRDAIDNAVNEAISLVSPLDDSIYAVVALSPGASSKTSVNCNTADTSQGVTLQMTVGSKGAGTNPEDVYSALSPAPNAGRLPPTLTSAAFLSIVEEYRYYIRQEYSDPTDTTSAPAPRLARARFFPNT
ncbi:MAG: prepilin-type N-terminal cleavage/methylation domain-containing protein, partial [Acidobacteriota bacterium]